MKDANFIFRNIFDFIEVSFKTESLYESFAKLFSIIGGGYIFSPSSVIRSKEIKPSLAKS